MRLVFELISSIIKVCNESSSSSSLLPHHHHYKYYKETNMLLKANEISLPFALSFDSWTSSDFLPKKCYKKKSCRLLHAYVNGLLNNAKF